MTDDPPLAELLQKSGDGDFLRTVAESVLQIIMEADVDGLIGAGRHERAGERSTWCNGYRDRSLDTRLGTLNLKIAANRALSGLFGRSDVTGLTQRDLVGAPEALAMAEGLRAIGASGAPSTGEVAHGANGEERWFVVTTSPIADSPADAPRFTTASFEITERKRAEAHQHTLLQELNHRVKNTLAIVQSLAAQTFHGDQAPPAARPDGRRRLHRGVGQRHRHGHGRGHAGQGVRAVPHHEADR